MENRFDKASCKNINGEELYHIDVVMKETHNKKHLPYKFTDDIPFDVKTFKEKHPQAYIDSCNYIKKCILGSIEKTIVYNMRQDEDGSLVIEGRVPILLTEEQIKNL